MVKQKFSGRSPVFLPIVLTFIIYFASTTSRAVTDYDEGFYAQAAQHMVESGNWVTAYANDVRFLEKPPLLYWVTAVSFKIFGINEFALRLPTAFAVVALVWIVVLTVRKLADERASLAAGLSTAFSIGTYIFTRETLHDVWLVLFIAVAMYAFLNWYLDPRHPLKPALVYYAAMAGAVLCKSVIGAVFPLGIVVFFFLLSKKWPKWRTLHLLPGFLLFSLLAVPWHWLAAIQNKGFCEFFFVGEQFMRFLGKHETVGSVPLAVFWALILVWFFPWTAFLPAAFARVRKNPDENLRILFKLASAWAIVILGFFSFSARLEHYVFPAIPALSLFVGVALHKNEESKSVSWAFRGLAILGILLVIIGAVAGIWFAAGGDFGSLLTNQSDRAGSTDFTILANMPLEIILELIHPAWITITSIALGFGIAFWFEVHRRRIHALMCVAVVTAVIFGMTHWSLRICEDLISSKKFAQAVEREAHTGDRLVVVGDYEAANSLNFYQSLQVEVVDGVAPTFPGDPGVVLTKREYLAVWRSSERVFVLAPVERIEEFAPEGAKVIRVLHRVLARNH
jgi:hypothetical protein